MNTAHSLNCNYGKHRDCTGQPPSAAMARFLPPEMRNRACACPCHDRKATSNTERKPSNG